MSIVGDLPQLRVHRALNLARSQPGPIDSSTAIAMIETIGEGCERVGYLHDCGALVRFADFDPVYQDRCPKCGGIFPEQRTLLIAFPPVTG